MTANHLNLGKKLILKNLYIFIALYLLTGYLETELDLDADSNPDPIPDPKLITDSVPDPNLQIISDPDHNTRNGSYF